jgi:hypothetical protein
MSQLLSKAELKKINERFPEGISSKDIVQIFQGKGLKFSEATFRKYVQMGLVERCRRVGEKGKHRGSHGLYPISTVERINSIKKLISGDITLEQLKGSYFSMRQKMEEVERILGEVTGDISDLVNNKERKERHDIQLHRELEILDRNAKKVIKSLQRLETAFLA